MDITDKIDSILESTGEDCFIFKAKNKKWYMTLGDDTRAFGPFASEEETIKFLDRNLPNPGGFMVDDRGTKPVPKKATK